MTTNRCPVCGQDYEYDEDEAPSFIRKYCSQLCEEMEAPERDDDDGDEEGDDEDY
jgi:endogenous inhibitor of DNA gyrase (YacG/DUF329 family)